MALLLDAGLWHMYIGLSDDSKIYEREIYCLLDFIGDLGGLFDGLIFITSMIFGFFVPSLFQSEFIETQYNMYKPQNQPSGNNKKNNRNS